MNLGDVTRHRAWRRLPMWALAAAVNTSVLLGGVVFLQAARTDEPISTWTLILVGWVGIAVYLAFGDVRTRCTPFEMGLPIAARRLWLTQLAAILTGGIVIIGLTLGVIGLHLRVLPGVAVEPGIGILASALVGGLVLSVLLLQVPRPTLFRVPLSRGPLAWTLGVLVGMPVLLVAAVSVGWPGLIPLLALIAGAAAWTSRAVPPTYLLAPRTAATDLDARRWPSPGGEFAAGWVVPITVARSLSTGFRELAGVVFVALFGVVLGGGLLAVETGSANELRFLYLPLTIYMMFVLIGPRLASMHHLDPLPLSRRPLVAFLILPYFFLLVAGYAAGNLVAAGARSHLEYVNFEEGEDAFQVSVPLRVYVLTRGEVPQVESPWGETRTPDRLSLFFEDGLAAYSPYETPAGSSERFVAWQISRAVEAVYGVKIPPETIESRYLRTEDDGRVVPTGAGLTLRTDYPELTAGVGPMFPVLTALVVVPWLLLAALLLRAYRAGVRERVRQTIVWGSLVVLLVMMIGGSMLPIFSTMRAWAPRALVEIPVMHLGASLGGTAATWLVATALIAAAYVLAQAQFLRMEVPTSPSRYTLLEFSAQQ